MRFTFLDFRMMASSFSTCFFFFLFFFLSFAAIPHLLAISLSCLRVKITGLILWQGIGRSLQQTNGHIMSLLGEAKMPTTSWREMEAFWLVKRCRIGNMAQRCSFLDYFIVANLLTSYWYTHTHTRIHTHTYIYMCVCVRVCVCVCVCVSLWEYTCVYIYIYTYVYVYFFWLYICALLNVRIFVHSITYKHRHTHK